MPLKLVIWMPEFAALRTSKPGVCRSNFILCTKGPCQAEATSSIWWFKARASQCALWNALGRWRGIQLILIIVPQRVFQANFKIWLKEVSECIYFCILQFRSILPYIIICFYVTHEFSGVVSADSTDWPRPFNVFGSRSKESASHASGSSEHCNSGQWFQSSSNTGTQPSEQLIWL